MNDEEYTYYINRRNDLIKSANVMSDYYDLSILFFCFVFVGNHVFAVITVFLVVLNFAICEKSFWEEVNNVDEVFNTDKKPKKDMYKFWIVFLKISYGITFTLYLISSLL